MRVSVYRILSTLLMLFTLGFGSSKLSQSWVCSYFGSDAASLIVNGGLMCNQLVTTPENFRWDFEVTVDPPPAWRLQVDLATISRPTMGHFSSSFGSQGIGLERGAVLEGWGLGSGLAT